MKAVYIVDDVKIAKILVDPMRRAILDLRQKPMTQAGLTNELGLAGASLNHHMKILRSNKLVTIFKREVERHRIMQIFLSSVAYLFVYDLDSLPKNIARYFYPVTLKGQEQLYLCSCYIIGNCQGTISRKLPRQLILYQRICLGIL